MSYRPRCLLNTAWRKVVPSERWVNSFKELDLQSWKLTQWKVFDCRFEQKNTHKYETSAWRRSRSTFIASAVEHSGSWTCGFWSKGDTRTAGRGMIGPARVGRLDKRKTRVRSSVTAEVIVFVDSAVHTPRFSVAWGQICSSQSSFPARFSACSVTRGSFGDVFRNRWNRPRPGRACNTYELRRYERRSETYHHRPASSLSIFVNHSYIDYLLPAVCTCMKHILSFERTNEVIRRYRRYVCRRDSMYVHNRTYARTRM